jgi:small GTP-binding protein
MSEIEGKPLNLVPKLKKVQKNEEKAAMELSEDTQYDVTDCKPYNILMIGDSRSGKSTFINLLKNINHVSKKVLFSETSVCKTHNVWIKYKNNNMSINIIDTPGVNEVGDTSRTNETINHMITSFVKQDVTKIHLVLITINILDSDKVKSITEIIKLLGAKLSKNMVLLVTHSEGRDSEEEQKWIEQFNKTKAFSFIKTACKAGFLFTGAIDEVVYKDVKMRDKFIILQKNRIAKFLNLLLSVEPEVLGNEVHKKAESKFQVRESVVNNHSSLKQLIPEVKSLCEQIVIARGKLNNLLIPIDHQNEVDSIIDEASQIGTNDIILPKIDENMKRMMEEQETLSVVVENELKKAREFNDQFTNILNELNRLINIIEFS